MIRCKKKEGISDHPVALSPRELRKWKWPSAGPRRAWRLLSPPPGYSLSTYWATKGTVGGCQGTSVPPVNDSPSPVGISTLHVAGGKCKAPTPNAMGVTGVQGVGKIAKTAFCLPLCLT